MSSNIDLVVVGSIAYDVVETPYTPAIEQLGGSAVYLSLVSSLTSRTGVVGVIGDDFQDKDKELMSLRGVDLGGMMTSPGETFRWSGRYDRFLKERDTLYTRLGVFADFKPELPQSYRTAPYLFLANIDPVLQLSVLDQMDDQERWIAADTMNFWIEGKRGPLDQLLSKINAIFINDSEATLLTGEMNMAKAGRAVQKMGPRTVVIKRGEHGAIIFCEDQLITAPAIPLEEVKDPTGAGDSFAGGFMAAIAGSRDTSPEGIRRAAAVATVVASFCVEENGPYHLSRLTSDQVNQRLGQYMAMVKMPERMKI